MAMTSTNPMSTGLTSLDLFGPDWDEDLAEIEAERNSQQSRERENILDGTVDNLLSWFHEDSEEALMLQEIISKAAHERAAMEMERERFQDYSPI